MRQAASKNRPRPAPDDAKLAELMLYVARRSEQDAEFGAIKLNKVLFYSDFIAYGRLRRPITAQVYQKLERGPAPRRLLPVQRKLLKEGAAATQIRDHFGFEQKRLVALRLPNLSGFTGEEIAIVDEVIDLLRDHNASEVSALSHELACWQLADLNQDIPYEAILLSSRPLTESEKAHARTIRPSRG
jgi:hypothetical protein